MIDNLTAILTIIHILVVVFNFKEFFID